MFNLTVASGVGGVEKKDGLKYFYFFSQSSLNYILFWIMITLKKNTNYQSLKKYIFLHIILLC